jgi:hypothetical protein
MLSIKYGSNFTESLDFQCVPRRVRHRWRATGEGARRAGRSACGKTRSERGRLPGDRAARGGGGGRGASN